MEWEWYVQSPERDRGQTRGCQGELTYRRAEDKLQLMRAGQGGRVRVAGRGLCTWTEELESHKISKREPVAFREQERMTK